MTLLLVLLINVKKITNVNKMVNLFAFYIKMDSFVANLIESV
jgi:hypothetical protein